MSQDLWKTLLRSAIVVAAFAAGYGIGDERGARSLCPAHDDHYAIVTVGNATYAAALHGDGTLPHPTCWMVPP